MPSHQDRVKLNYCIHSWPIMDIMIMMDFPDLPDGRKCIKCGASWNKIHGSCIIHITSTPNPGAEWIKKRFL